MKQSSGFGGLGGNGPRRQRGLRISDESRRFSSDAAKGRRPRQWAAALAAIALVLMGGVGPAFAEDAPPEAPPAAVEAPPAAPPADPAPPAPVEEVPPAPPADPPPAPAPAPEAPPAQPAPPADAPPAPAAPAPEAMSMSVASADEAVVLPFLKWKVVDAAGVVQPGVSLNIQGALVAGSAAENEELWLGAAVATVVDNIGQEGYVGSDLDPVPGEFLVRQLVNEADPTSVHDVAAGEGYRARPTVAPEGFVVGDEASWAALTAATAEETPAESLTLAVPVVEDQGKSLSEEPQELMAAEDLLGDPVFETLALPPGASPTGFYTSSGDSTNPTGWYSAGTPAEAARINSFTSQFTQVGQNWVLGATWTRPSGTGSMGWSVEYTVAPERWGGANQGNMVPVPQPDRSQGGFVVFVHNDNQGNFATSLCTYTSQGNYPGSCQNITPSPMTSQDSNRTLILALTLPENVVGTIGCPPTLGSTGYIRSWTGANNNNSRNIQAWSAPVTVEPPSNCGTTTLRITKMGDRTDTNLIPGNNLTQGTPVAGAVYEAFASTAGASGQPTGASLGTCTTAANGVCEIQVSNAHTNGVWIQEVSTPAGWSNMPSLGTGPYDGTKTVTPYQFRVAVGTGSNNVTRNVTADRNLPNTAVSGAWTNVRNNPPFPQICGLKIAMVFDTSTSINSGEMTQFKNAAQLFVGTNGLGGTPSSATMFQFNTTAGTLNGGVAYDLAIPGSAASNTGYLGAANQIQTGLPSSGNGFTNWDAALRLVKSSGSYDMVLFLTDGDPTTYGSGSETNTNVQFRMVEQAVLSANSVKNTAAPGGGATKIVGVGVGLATNSYLNLQAITGPAVGDDYFLAGNFGALEQLLREIAVKNCGSSLTVIKQIQNPAGQVISANTAGWQFTATGNVVNGSPATQTTTASGTNFALTYNDLNTHTVAVTETLQPGYEYIGTVCTNAAGDVVQTALGFTVPVKLGLITSCTVTNRELPQTADVVWTKVDDQQPAAMLGGSVWTIVGPGHPDPGTAIMDCTGLPCAGLDKDPAVGGFKLEGLAWGTYTVTETTAPPGHTGGNSFTVTVDATNQGTTINKGPFVNPRLPGSVIWKKVDDQQPAAMLGGSEWTIVGPGHADPGTVIVDCTGLPCAGLDKDPAVGGFKLEGLAWGSYTVTETQAPPGHTGGNSFNSTVNAQNAGTVIDRGSFVNPRLTGAVIWSKVSSDTGGLLEGSEWKIVGPAPAVTELAIVDCTSAPCAGPDLDPVAGQFKVEGLAWGNYSLIETKAPPGHLLDTTAHIFSITANNAGTTVDLGDFENVPVTPPDIPLTGGLGSDQVLIGGAILLAIATIAGLTLRRRQRTMRGI